MHNNKAFYTKLESLGICPEGETEVFSEEIKCALFNLVISHLDANAWCLTCDMDEFHDYGVDFWQLVEDNPICDNIYGMLIDRFARRGYHALTSEPSLEDQFPVCSNFSSEVLGAATHKIMAVKGGIEISLGHHYVKGRDFGKGGIGPFKINHFKWDRSVLSRLKIGRGNVASDAEAQRFFNNKGLVQ